MTAGSYGPGNYGYSSYGPGGYNSMRATDADRERVRVILQDAHAQGRLTWDEFDTRTTALLQAQTYGQLGELTADLVHPMPIVTPPQAYPYQPASFGMQRSTNGMAIASLICGVFVWFLAGIPAIVLGHIARRQIRETGEAGDGMALAGMILGYIGLALSVLGLIFIVAFASHVHGQIAPFPHPTGGPPVP